MLPPRQTKDNSSYEQQKYAQIRKKLNELGFNQTLHPDSVELVDKIISQYQSLNSRYIKLKKAQNNQLNNPQINNFKQKIYNLQSQLDLINDQNHQLKIQNQQLKNKTQSLESNQKLKKMQSTFVKYQNQINSLTQKIRELQALNDQYKNNYQKSGQDKQRSKTIMQAKIKQQDDYNAQLRSVLQKKNVSLNIEIEEKSKMKLKISALQKIIEDLQSQKNQIIKINSNTNNQRNELLKNQIQQLERKNELYRLQLMDSKSQNQKLKMAIKNLNDQIMSLKNQQIKIKQNQSLNSHAKNEIQKIFQQTKNKLTEKMQIIDKLEKQKIQNQKFVNIQNQQIKQIKNKQKMLTDRINQLQNEISSLGQKMTQKIKQNRQLQNIRISYETKIKQYQVQKIKQQQLYAPNKIREIDQQAMKREYQKRQKNYESEIKVKEKQVDQLKKNQRQIIIENDKIKGQLNRKSATIMKGQQQIEQMQNQRERFMKQNSQLQKLLKETQNIDYDSKSQIIRLRQNLNSYELIITDLKSQLKSIKSGSTAFNTQIENLQNQLNRQQQKSREVYEDNRQLKMSNDSLTRTNKELLQKYKTTQYQNSQKQNIKNQSTKQIYKLKDQIELLRNQLQQKQMSLRAIDNQRDELQDVLDQKTQQNARLNHMLQNLQRQLQNSSQGLVQTDINYQSLYKKYNDLQDTHRRALFQNQNQVHEIQDLRTLISKKDITIGQLQNELSLTVMGSKNQNRQTDSLKNELCVLDKRLKQKNKDYDQLREKNGQLKIQIKQYHQNYQKQRAENIKLVNWVKELESANNDIFQKITLKDRQIEQLNQLLIQYQRKQGALNIGIIQYQKQINQLSHRLQRNEDQLRIAYQQRDDYKIQAQSWRRQSSGVDWRAILQQKNHNLQLQNASKKRQLQLLRKKVRQMEQICKQERQKNCFLQSQLQIQGTPRTNNNITPIKLIDSRASIENYNQNQNWNNYNTDPQNNMNPRSPSNSSSQTFLFDTSMSKSYTHSQVLQPNTLNTKQNLNMKKNNQINVSQLSRQSMQSDQGSVSSVIVQQKIKNAHQKYKIIQEKQQMLKKKITKS